MVGQIGSALGMLFQPLNLLLIVIGVGSGILVGALPGLTATMAIALLVPLYLRGRPGTEPSSLRRNLLRSDLRRQLFRNSYKRSRVPPRR